MKKVVSIVLVLVMLCSALIGCGKEKECEVCGDDYKGKTYKVEILGEKFDACKECRDGIKELRDGFSSYLD